MDINAAHICEFATAAGFSAWLAEHHDREREVWLKLQRKTAGAASFTWGEAVVEALAWGWIDGIKKANDDASWFQRFTPRQPRSKWSRINRGHAERLIAEDTMQEPGLRQVTAAKADGRWEAAYAGSADMVFPEDFLRGIEADATAKATFDKLSRARRYAVFHRLQTAKREETRQKLMAQLTGMLSRGTWPD
jgi:uncharacterized protein YdeI (YjbR/CyaY-like superfamily)